MELDEALLHVADLAHSVQGAQGRLRSLIRAITSISGDLRLPVVLRHIVEAARELAGARYAALGVIGIDGQLEQFIHSGMDDDVAGRVGHLPEGDGILGLLITDPRPVRLGDLSEHPAAAGFPAHHPPMRSFLGVPVSAGERVFGNLYLTESSRGTFSADDEQLVIALAGSAGVAIENARLYEKSERQRAWLGATAEVAQQLLAQNASPLGVILEQAAAASDADVASVVLNDPERGWNISAILGAKSIAVGSPVDLRTTLAGRVIGTGKPTPVSEYDRTTDNPALEAEHLGSCMAVPLLGRNNTVIGALSLARLTGRPRFADDDVDKLVGFAAYVGVAIELDRSRIELEKARIAEDRARIAADLHDHVIQEIFATGMGLQSALGDTSPQEVRKRVAESVDALDQTIKQIRSTIFQLNTPLQTDTSLHHRLLTVIEDHSPGLGFSPTVKLSGSMRDLDRDGELVDDVVAVAREALANIARHANATEATVEVAFDGTIITVSVTDDGDGMKQRRPTSGLTNLRHRAEVRKGRFAIEPNFGGGTRITWEAQVRSSS